MAWAKVALLLNRARTGVPGGAAPLGWWMRLMLEVTLARERASPKPGVKRAEIQGVRRCVLIL